VTHSIEAKQEFEEEEEDDDDDDLHMSEFETCVDLNLCQVMQSIYRICPCPWQSLETPIHLGTARVKFT
jgi:hypothetical protein